MVRSSLASPYDCVLSVMNGTVRYGTFTYGAVSLGYCSLEQISNNPCVLLDSTVRCFGTAARTIDGLYFEGIDPPELNSEDFQRTVRRTVQYRTVLYGTGYGTVDESHQQ